MRIAIYHNLTSGGAKRALYEEMKRLALRHTLDVFTPATANTDFLDVNQFANRGKTFPFKPLQMLDSPFGRLNQIIRLRNLRRMRVLNRTIAAKIDAGGYDVVFVHPCQIENSPSVLDFINRTPSVYYCQEPLRILYESMPARPYDRGESARRRVLNRLDPLPGLFRSALRKNDRANLSRAKRVLVNSQFMRTAVTEIYGIDPQVAPLGVDADRFRPLNLEREPFGVSVGSLTPLKGFDFLIEAVGKIPAAERIPLVIASNFQNPPERDYLVDLAGRCGVELKLMGNVSDDLLIELYNRAAVTLYAPIREPFGFVSIESMACETPVVGVSEGGLRETVVEGVTGLLSRRDPDLFADAVCGLLAEPARRAEFGAAGRRHILESWTWERSVRRLEQYLTF